MMTAIAIAPRMFSNIIALLSQAGAGVKIKRSRGKGRRANGDEDKVESEAKHWRSFLAQHRSHTTVLLLSAYYDGGCLL